MKHFFFSLSLNLSINIDNFPKSPTYNIKNQYRLNPFFFVAAEAASTRKQISITKRQLVCIRVVPERHRGEKKKREISNYVRVVAVNLLFFN